MTALTLVVALAVAQSEAPWGTGQSRPEDLVVTLVTFSPGDTLTELWGHTALVVEDRRLNHGRLYNYGMFDFNEGFVHRFVQGRLEFWVDDAPIVGTYDFYKRVLDRDVRLQVLALTPSEAQVVAKALAENVKPQNRVYLYHHYNDNCSTRPRDIIDLALHGQIKAATDKPARMSLRLHTRRYSSASPVMSVVLDYLQNDELERPITLQNEAFLPDELERQLDAISVTHDDGTVTPLVKEKRDWFKSKRAPPPEVPPNWIPHLFVLGCLFGGAALGLGHLGRKGARWPRVLLGAQLSLVGLVWGAFGLFLFIVGIFTNHTVAHRNENLFGIGPLHWLLLPLGVQLMWGRAKAWPRLRAVGAVLAAISALGVLVKVLPAFDQANWNLIALTLPVNVAVAALGALGVRAQPKSAAPGVTA